MAQLSEDVLAALRGMDSSFKQATPDTDGSFVGQRWPSEGPCNAWLKDFRVELEPFRYEKQEVPGVAYKFLFETMDQPDNDNFEFQGAVFRFPQKLDELKGTFSSGTRARVEIESNRLMGHLTSLLGARPVSIEAGSGQVAEMIEVAAANGNPVAVGLNIQYQKRTYGGQERTFQKEFITELLSVANAT
jgi:hypothetical protein